MSFNVLIADIDQGSLQLIDEALQNEGFQTATCQSGSEAVKLIQNKNFNLVICEQELPELKGSEVAKFMKSRRESAAIPFILASAEFNPVFYAQLVKENLINIFVPEPFHAKQIVNLIKVLLKR